ncbi:hypothetical protein V8G54_033123 [Vigna mungo]|uniref:Uncharacterized protein n=1 Tax=Vigna mungo TaxID=3915 RepID=A0AAQ3MND9_VIGMU
MDLEVKKAQETKIPSNDDEKNPKATQEKTKSSSDAPTVKDITIDHPEVEETARWNNPQNNNSSDGKVEKGAGGTVQNRTESGRRTINNSGTFNGNANGSFFEGTANFTTNNMSCEWRRWQSRKMTNIEKHDLVVVDAPTTWMRYRVDVVGELRYWRQSSHDTAAVRAKEMMVYDEEASFYNCARLMTKVQRPWNFVENEGNGALAERLAFDGIWRRKWLCVMVAISMEG